MLIIGVSPVAASPNETVVEWLRFAVPQEEQALFITKETEIWEPVNRRSPEYLGKEIWQDQQHLDQLLMINYWRGENHRKTITTAMVKTAEQDFEMAMGKPYEILEKKTFKKLLTEAEL